MSLPDCANATYIGTTCLPGLYLNELSGLREQLCQPRPVSLCDACSARPLEAPCAAWGSGRLQLARADPVGWQPPDDALCAGDAGYARGTACRRRAPSRSEAWAMLANRTIVFRGDSLMRQVFLRTVAWFRGLSAVADVSFHSDAIYLGGREAADRTRRRADPKQISTSR